MASYKPLVICTIFMGNQKIVATNDGRTSPRFRVKHDDGNITYAGHAEMRALVKVKHYDHPEKLKVVVERVRKNGTIGMSMPCKNCQIHLWKSGIKARNVWFSNEDGKLERMTSDKH